MKIKVSDAKGEIIEVEVDEKGSIGDIKKAIAASKGIAAKNIRIFDLNQKIVKNSQKIESLNLTPDDVISMFVAETEGQEKDNEFDVKKVFNAVVKKIKDQPGDEETETEIIVLLENPKVQLLFETLSCDSKLFRQLIDDNSILQKNPHLEECIIRTFENLGAYCDPKQAPVTLEGICNVFGIKYDADLQKKLEDPEISQAFEDIKQGIKLVGGLEVISVPPPRHVKLDLERIFANEIAYMNSMGFYDTKRILRCLEESGGDLNGAIDFMFMPVN